MIGENGSSDDTNQLLWDMNNEKARLFIPAIIYVGTTMLIGLGGNIMVLYFYGYKSKPSPPISFIIALAIFDLLTCLIGMPMEIADLRYYFNFKSEAACKILRSVTYFSSVSSCLTLVLIAFDRHRRICRPLAKQLNDTHVKVLCIVVGISSAVFSWPAIVFNKVVSVNLPTNQNVVVNGHICTTTKEEHLKLFVIITNSIYLIVFVTITIVLCILYFLISRQLLKHKKFRFYLAKKSAQRQKIHVKSLNNAGEHLLPRETSSVFADPPDATGSVQDLRELVTQGMPAVEHDRPLSGFTVVSRTTGATGLTDISGKNRRSQSLKNVTICSSSQNQVYHIESRGNEIVVESEEQDRSMQDLNESGGFVTKRPGSASSFASFSSRPSSATLSSFEGESSKRPMKMFHDEDDSDENVEFEDQIDDTVEFPNGNENADTGQPAENQGQTADGESAEILEKSGNGTTDTAIISYSNSPEESNNDEIVSNVESKNSANSCSAFDRDDTVIQDTEETTEPGEHELKQPSEPDIRPSSVDTNSTNVSKTSKLSWPYRRANVVTPSSNVTLTSSVVSRASSIRRLRRLFSGAFNTGKTNQDSDKENARELRLKMLDTNTVKYTMIMLIITAVFVVSFLPYLALVIWRYYKDEHEANIMTDTELVLFQIGIRSIFLNSAVNPIIYGGFNSKFRAFFFGVFCKCCMACKRRGRTIVKTADASSSTS